MEGGREKESEGGREGGREKEREEESEEGRDGEGEGERERGTKMKIIIMEGAEAGREGER